MKNLISKLAKRNKFILGLYLIIVVAFGVSFFFFTQSILSLSGIENFIRYGILIFFGIYYILYFFYSLVRIIQKKYKRFIVYTVFTIIFIIGFFFGSYYINVLYDGISGLSESDEVVYKAYLINLNESEFNEDSTTGMIANKNDIEGYELANNLIEKENLNNEVKEYEDYYHMISDLYEGVIDAIYVPSNYISLFTSEEDFADIEEVTKVVYEHSEKLENQDKTIISTKDFDEPISFLIMGVDSTIDGLDANAAFNGDTLMLLTFNPHTLNVTMMSIPRDTMVPIACNNNKYAKINSSAAYGTECVIDTVSNLTDIEIDYYVKINFKGVVDLVDALGGVEVDVEKPDYNTYNGQVCEQNSDREFGSELICMDSGLQTLDGEQALAYARNRKLYTLSDIDRNRHQQQVVTAIVNKIVTLSSFKDFEKILDTVSKNIVTNMSIDQILSGYTVLKDVMLKSLSGSSIGLNIEKSFLEVYNIAVYIASSGRNSSSLGYYSDSLDDIVNMMKINLEISEPEVIKTFSFSVNEPYEATTAGEGFKSVKTVTTMENFLGLTEAEAKTFCNENNLTCKFTIVDSTNEHYNPSFNADAINYQSVHQNTLLGTFNTVEFYKNGAVIETVPENNTTNNSGVTDNTNVDEENPLDPTVEGMVSE